ncbi:hypothetical protein B0T24DRAFT_553527 [Lasiosphaeria ovina]|uniref:NmrA-like domain-containing protein n=1 Tax=Lasiosphaeria ovina TaxID=92902 RepID=A0AAE0KC68_9PEZI|nr:hypothetical protein B0T24DRAFT_553527 [Lasiosphaeria ovina]
MVKVAVAGGSGQVAREVIDALVAAGKHEITVLSRSKASPDGTVAPGVGWRVVDYSDTGALVSALRGTHTLLSFVQLLSDPGCQSQKNLIDACIAAGVKRFAPSEYGYGSVGSVNLPFWKGKEVVREYLKEVNEKEKVLEYTLFMPGLFLDYLATPYQTAKHIAPLDLIFDYQNCRQFMVEGHEDAIMTLTTAADTAAIVARAVDYGGEWPVNGGIRGNRVTFSQIVKLGEKVRGRPFTIDKVKLEDLQAGVLKTPWILARKHSVVSDEQAPEFSTAVPIGMMLTSVSGAWDVGDEFNRLFPDYQFTQMEPFLADVWEGKP